MIYVIADMMTGVIEAIILFMLLDAFCLKRENLNIWVYYIGIGVLAILINLCNSIFNVGLISIISMPIVYFCSSFLFKGDVRLKAIISVLSYLLIIIVEILVLFGLTVVFKTTVSGVVDDQSNRLLVIVLSKTLTFLIGNIVRVRCKKKNLYLGTSYWVSFFLMFAVSTIAVFLIFKLSYNIKITYLYNLSIICSVGLLFSTFFSLYLYEHLAEQADIIRKQQQYEHNLKMQLKHFDEILVAQNKIKKFKHDFQHYIIGLQAYLDNDDCCGAKEHIQSLKEIFNSGKGIVETGNTALDAVISTKKAIAENKGIFFQTKIQIPERIPVDATDICIIFGNALDNAIEACEKVKNRSKQISLTMICQDETVFCKIVNTADIKNSLLMTSKYDKSNHGFGLESIRTALEKYNSNPTIELTEKEFTLKFVVFL